MITLFITILLTLGLDYSSDTTYQDNNTIYEQSFDDVKEGDVAKSDENEGNN